MVGFRISMEMERYFYEVTDSAGEGSGKKKRIKPFRPHPFFYLKYGCPIKQYAIVILNKSIIFTAYSLPPFY